MDRADVELESSLAATLTAAERPARSARKAKGEGHARRGEILQAAERLFVDCGYEGATIRKLADEVGVSSTALYMHFRDKSEILLEICEAGFAKLLALTEAIESEGHSPREAVKKRLEAYVAFGFDNPNAYRLIYMTRPGEAGGAEVVAQRVGRSLFQRFREPLETLAAQGKLRVEPELAAQMLWSGAHGVVSLIITKPYFGWAPREQLVCGVLEALLKDLIAE